ncbi:MAG: hypothetical protein WC810_03080 [Janthinobacterium sp.]|jgi:co-chaperonin GroES (HSP10)
MINNISPTPGVMFCEVLSDYTITDSGLVLARTIKEQPHRAKVVKTGAPAIRSCDNCDRVSCNSNKLQKRWKWYQHSLSCPIRGKDMALCAGVGDIAHFKPHHGCLYHAEKGGKEYIFLVNQDIIAKEK